MSMALARQISELQMQLHRLEQRLALLESYQRPKTLSLPVKAKTTQ